ncbi:hypothetical protein FOA43_002156 [Brettanomyces nanus]|uniref:DUF292-domain-containing protein n=1 Tax=Eeniella nana TaxID=13502 RepID=A0A875RPB0_EENNA|nr:uncharacterized protein FOA43_002156 [Brettanomyces nanus]QPG74820.1 hypothetical protein FOA43_002156 [Brettanomyces nanus]
MAISEETVFKTALKMTVSKLKFKADKMRTLNRLSLSSISKELNDLASEQGSKFDRELTMNKIRISKLVTDDNTADVYEILMVDCELLLSRLNRLLSIKHDRKTGEIEAGADETVIKLAKKMIFASSYISIKEFRKLATLLANKFGRPFYEQALIDDSEDDFVKKCKGENVDELTEMYLKEFCETYRIDLYGEGKYEVEKGEGEASTDASTDASADAGAKTETGTEAGTEAAPASSDNAKEDHKSQTPLNDMDDLKKRFSALKRL